MFAALHQRLWTYFRAVRVILQAGGTFGSVLLYPLRRRSARDPRCQVDFFNGTSLSAPSDLPLLNLIEEIWIKECYRTKKLPLRPGATIVDIGANVGIFSVLLATANPQARIIAVEPGRGNLEFLSRNLISNRLHNVNIVPAACGGTKGEGTLYGRGAGVLNTLYMRDTWGNKCTPLYKTSILTLQDIFDQFNVETCDLLKLDCEGAEYDILLNNSKETLRRVSNISMEYHVGFNDHSLENLEQLLMNHGFVINSLPMDEEGAGMLYASKSLTDSPNLIL